MADANSTGAFAPAQYPSNTNDFSDEKRDFVRAFFMMEQAATGSLGSYSTVDGRFEFPAEKRIFMLGQLVGEDNLSPSGYVAYWHEIGLILGADVVFSESKKTIADNGDSGCVRVSKVSSGFVYVARNASIPGVLKIGMTTRGVEERLRELGQSSSIPSPFELVGSFRCDDVSQAEADIHLAMDMWRVSKAKEFFSVSESVALSMCRAIIGGEEVQS